MVAPNPVVFASPQLWAAHIAAHATFPDERLNARLGIILHTLADKPFDSFPQACGCASQAKALYRFLDNARLDPEDFLQPLVDTTLDGCRGLPTLLAIQDSSSVNYATLLTTQGLGKLNDSDARGLHVHTTLAARPDGVPCGLLHQSYWSRGDGPPVAPQRRQRPIQDKESYKWLDGIEAAEAALDNLPAEQRPRLLHIFDREGDIHEALQRISDTPHGAIIRSAQNRSVRGEVALAHDAVRVAPLIGVKQVDIPAQHGGKKRQAKLELRSVTLTLTPNAAKYPQRRPVTWTLVEAREVETPEGVEPLHWLLWTTEPASTLQEIEEILRLYKLRWCVEDFHLTLKSGCQVEKLRLESAARLIKALTLYSAVALRIVALRDLARQMPTAPCTMLLDSDSWQALYTYCQGRRPTPETPVPTIRQAVLWIGRLGGHLGRKGDGMPGVRVLWRGWRDLTLLVAGYRAGQQER